MIEPLDSESCFVVRLISRDSNLRVLCQEIGNGLPHCSWEFSTDPPGASRADLYIWDFEPDSGLPSDLCHPHCRHLFLVDRKDVAKFHKAAGRKDLSILLKPVTRATLSAFVGLAVAAHVERFSVASSLRADRDEILQCLIQANLKLQEFDQDRTNFLARALHDVHAPLTAISGYCDLLVDEALGPLQEEQKEVLRRMNRSAKRLSRMLSAMFRLSVDRQVDLRLEQGDGDIHDCLDQALQEIMPHAASKDISVSNNLDPAGSSLHFESPLIEQVLINLLDNACRFTPKAGEIEIRGYPTFWERRSKQSPATMGLDRRRQNSREPNAYRVDILNSGPLIPREHLEDIFKEYKSYSGGQDRSGGGLGLAICRMVIKNHQGRIWAENLEDGPMFSLILPYRTATMISSKSFTEARR